MTWPIRRLHIETSTVCNTDCPICPQALVKRPKKIDIDRVRRLITDDAAEYRATLDLFEFHNYNEPLIYFDLFCELTELVNSLYGTEKVGLVSNASLMDPSRIDRLLGLRLKHVIFSVDGFTKDVYEAHRPGLDRNVVYENIDRFVARSREANGPVPLINYVVTEANAHEATHIQDHFRHARAQVHLSGCDGRGSNVDRLIAIRDMASSEPCDYALDGVYVLSNLDVVTCCEDWDGRHVVGNLAQSTLKEVVDNTRYQEFRDLHFAGRKCEIDLCHDCRTNMSYRDSHLKTWRA